MGGGDTDLPGCTGQGTVTYLQISLLLSLSSLPLMLQVDS